LAFFLLAETAQLILTKVDGPPKKKIECDSNPDHVALGLSLG